MIILNQRCYNNVQVRLVRDGKTITKVNTKYNSDSNSLHLMEFDSATKKFKLFEAMV